jgi:potassium efflux system protein
MAFGQAAPPKPFTEAEFVTLLQGRLKQVDDAGDLDAATKSKIKELYQQAIAEMSAAKRWGETGALNDKLATEAPKELEQTKADLAAMPSQSMAIIPPDASLSWIEQDISKREADLEKLRKALADDEAELNGRASRRAKIPELVTAAKERLTTISSQLELPPAANENPALNSARRMMFVARRRTAEQELSCYEKELMAYEARTELLPLHRDLLARRVDLAEQETKQRQELANQRRHQEAERQTQQAKWEAAQADPAMAQLVKGNAQLAAMRTPLGERIAEVLRQRAQVDQDLTRVTSQYKDIQQKVEVAGTTNATSAIGLLLRNQRLGLPDVREHGHNVESRRQIIDDVQYELQKLEDERSALAKLDEATQNELRRISLVRQNVNSAELTAPIYEALKTKRDYLLALKGDYNSYYEKLVDLNTAERNLIKQTEDCARYIDERVLWIASTTPLGPIDVSCAHQAFWQLADASLGTGRALVVDAARTPAVTALALGLISALIFWRPRFRARLREIGDLARRRNCCNFLPTLETAVLTTLIAAVWPGSMWYVGWRLAAAADASQAADALQWCRAIGEGLLATARVFLALELLRLTCGQGGLGESHFGWPAAALKSLRQTIRWFNPPALVLMCVTVAMAWQNNDRWDAALGRICFVAGLLCFSLALHRILRPRGAVFQAMVAARRGGWLERFRYVWYPLCVLTPAALAVLSAIGYHYTARQLVIRLILTAYVLVGGVIARALLLRWTMVNQRKLAIEQARHRRAAAQTENTSGEDTAELAAAATPDRDIATINTQTRRLIEYSLAVACALVVWCAWIDVLPALSSMNIRVWQTTVSVAIEVPNAYGGKKLDTQDQLRDIRLAELLLVAIVLATTVIAAKNIPGLLEMAVLQHLPFDAGARYAVATVCRYLITVVGILLCFGILGIGWSTVQWLVAAMSLGLGFGLQEIFANFISGLIILFERPVRVGDVVTIDNITGVVSRIRMRATTITDGDRKELIIPNKEFITGRVLNWTLTDPVNRVVINVAAAYGSDTQQVAGILMKLAQDHPNVLDDPPPRVSLESFGDSALNFVLRCFLPNLDNRGTVIHELHMAIEREFRAADIEMPFPQHDVHVRTFDVPQAASWAPALPARTPGRAA